MLLKYTTDTDQPYRDIPAVNASTGTIRPEDISKGDIFVLPSWIHRQLSRYNLTVNDLRSYSKLREVLTIDDMAEWFYLNDQLTLQNNQCRFSTSILETYFDSMTLAEKVELSNSVLPLSGTEDIANSANSKLSATNVMSDCLYQFVRVDNGLFLILKEGFNAELAKKDGVSNFVKAYLKKCYESMPIHRVSSISMFGFYLKHLQSS